MRLIGPTVTVVIDDRTMRNSTNPTRTSDSVVDAEEEASAHDLENNVNVRRMHLPANGPEYADGIDYVSRRNSPRSSNDVYGKQRRTIIPMPCIEVK